MVSARRAMFRKWRERSKPGTPLGNVTVSESHDRALRCVQIAVGGGTLGLAVWL